MIKGIFHILQITKPSYNLKIVKKIYEEADAKTIAINGISFEVSQGQLCGDYGSVRFRKIHSTEHDCYDR